MGTADAAGCSDRMDTEVSGRLKLPGRVCFGDFAGQPVDCVAYGASPATTAAAARRRPRLRHGVVAHEHHRPRQHGVRPRGAGAEQQCDHGNTRCVRRREYADGDGGRHRTPTATVVGSTPTATVMPTGADRNDLGLRRHCNDTNLSIDELVRGVNISLGLSQLVRSLRLQHNGMVGVNCLIQGVSNSLDGCS
jgi:hypothetical protein